MTSRLADVSARVLAVEWHPGLVALHQALQAGWNPPDTVTEELYYQLRHSDAADPLHAFVGFGCSFGGIRTGYAKTDGRNYAGEARRALLRDTRPNVTFIRGDAGVWIPTCPVDFFYIDPPYTDTQGYVGAKGYGAAPTAEPPPQPVGGWWKRAQELAAIAPVFISEYAAAPPVAAELVWSAPSHARGLNAGRANEHLWRVTPLS